MITITISGPPKSKKTYIKTLLAKALRTAFNEHDHAAIVDIKVEDCDGDYEHKSDSYDVADLVAIIGAHSTQVRLTEKTERKQK